MPNEFGGTVRDTINVDSYDEFVKKIEDAGGKMLTEKMEVPGMGFTGSFQDTDGNIFGIIEYKEIKINNVESKMS
ncbi:MAG: hypothetical protein WCE60_01395 [Methanobacterium sp.]